MKINTYVVNLKTSVVRKEYMETLLSPFACLDVKFVEAVDGRILSDDERNGAFDADNCVLHYGRMINPGEIGCTLSHRKCYRQLVNSANDYALILEDDISIVGDTDTAFNEQVVKFMQSDEPHILFLSGDYWYWRRKPISRVFWAVGSYAYYINKAAARRILQIAKPYNVADDWDMCKGLGIKLYAVHPYVIDANLSDLPSDIRQEHWGNLKRLMSRKCVLRSYYTGLVKRCLWKLGHWESKVRNEGE